MMDPYKKEIQYELDQVLSATSSDFSGLAMKEQHDSRIRWLFASGNTNERYKELAIRPGRGLSGLVIKLGRPVILDATMQDLERQRQRLDYSIMLVEQLHAVIAVPITIRYEICGVLLIGNRTERLYEKNVLQLVLNGADRLVLLLREIKFDELKK